MPFLKFSRDKRGYEHFSLVEPIAGRTGRRPRILFWFRTPPQMKIGREPFTEEVRRAIETRNPGLKFDWAKLMATPVPAPDVEHWRERRRAERAARDAAREPEPEDADAAASRDVAAEDALVRGEGADLQAEATSPASDGDEHPPTTAPAAAGDVQPASPASIAPRRRRRRRGHRKPRSQAETTLGSVAPNAPGPPNEEV